MGALRPYEDYQTMPEVWLNKIPAHWDYRKTKFIFKERSQKGFSELPLLAATQTHGVIPKAMYENRTVIAQKDLHLLKLVKQGDFVISLRSFQGGVEYAHYEGIISPAYTVLSPLNSYQAEYFKYLFKSGTFIDSLKLFVTGIREGQNIDYNKFKDSILPLPPQEDILAIVNYLNFEIRKINRFIRNKKKLIALLKEQKQLIIHQAVTRGLNPDVRLKPSGVEWLGDIPEHWEVTLLKHCITRIEQGWSPQCDAQPATPNEYGVLKVGCVNKDHFDPSQNKRLPSALKVKSDLSNLKVKQGDILVSRANTKELVGLATLVSQNYENLLLCDKLFRFQAQEERIIPEFLVQTIRSKESRSQIQSTTNGASSSMQNIGQGTIKNLFVSLPPLAEQKEIVNFITDKTKCLSEIISKAETEIFLINEYRTRLISDVVTGKVDVRGVAVPLADDTTPLQDDDPTADLLDDDDDLLTDLEDEEALAHAGGH